MTMGRHLGRLATVAVLALAVGAGCQGNRGGNSNTDTTEGGVTYGPGSHDGSNTGPRPRNDTPATPTGAADRSSGANP